MTTTVSAALAALTILALPGGEPLSVDELADRLVLSDVVFLGEVHDNKAGHAAHLEILRALHRRHPDLVLSMEMFERDVQGTLDDYLADRIDEETFLEHARPWPGYREHYRPLVEYARTHGLDVLAANVPRKLARRVSVEGVLPGRRRHAARTTTAPRNRYYELFLEAMEEHPGDISSGTMMDFYRAQCLKDDTMAETIADYLADHPARDPLVVHVCGRFHSDEGLGTVRRLLARRPLARTSVVSMLAMEEDAFELSEHRDLAHYVLLVPPEEDEEEEEEKPAVAAGDTGGEAAGEEAASRPATRPVGDEARGGEREVQGRAGLGIMPDYMESDEPGLIVDAVSPKGPADKAGLEDGDRIVSLGGVKITDIYDYMDELQKHRPGEKVAVEVVRDGKKIELEVTLGVRGR